MCSFYEAVNMLSSQMYTQSIFWKNDHIVHLCNVVPTSTDFGSGIQSVSVFRCDVRGLDLLRVFLPLCLMLEKKQDVLQ